MKYLLLLLALPLAAQVKTDVQQLGTQGNAFVVTFRWTADAAGAVPVTPASISACCQGFVVTQIENVPGTSVIPTVGYSLAVLDTSGMDMLAGAGVTLPATPKAFAVTLAVPPLQGNVSLKVTANSVPFATGVVYVFLTKPSLINLIPQPQVITGVTIQHTFAAPGTFGYIHNLKTLYPIVFCYVLSGTNSYSLFNLDANTTSVSYTGTGAATITCSMLKTPDAVIQ